MSGRRGTARSRRGGISLFFLLVSAGLLAADSADLSWLDGRWTGVGHQLGNSEEWAIELEADSSLPRYEIAYPSMGCRGTWELTRSEEGVAWFTEVLTEGLDVCADGGTVAIARINDRFIAYSFFYPEEDALDSFSVLARE